MNEETGHLLAEAREWSSNYASWGDNGLVDRLADALEATASERDAALAVIERVRAINTGNNRALYGNDFEAGMAKALWLVKTALDGAPEPEDVWEYEYADDDDPEGNVYGQFRRVVGPWLPVEGETP